MHQSAEPTSGESGGGGSARHYQGLALVLVVVLAAIVAVRADWVPSYKVLFFVVLIPSVILHEVSHGAVALAFGDDTAKRAGRLTLNPVSHVDLFGTLVLPIVMTISGLGAIGYAKPVPYNPAGLRHPRNEALLVALAGPVVNVVLAVGAAMLFRATVDKSSFELFGLVGGSVYGRVVFLFGYANVLLAAFNLLPIPPLDGSAVIERLMPRSWWPGYMRMRALAFPVLIVAVLLLSTRIGGSFNAILDWWGHLAGLG